MSQGLARFAFSYRRPQGIRWFRFAAVGLRLSGSAAHG